MSVNGIVSVSDDKKKVENGEGNKAEDVYAQVQKKKPIAPTKPKIAVKETTSSEEGNTGSLVKDSIFKMVDDGYQKLFSSQVKSLEDVNQRLAVIEMNQMKLNSDFSVVTERMLTELQTLQSVTIELQKSISKSIDQQEKFALSVHDQFTETADHLGGQLMGVLKELQEVSNNHKHMVTSLSLIVSSYVCPSVKGDKMGKKINLK